MTGDCKDEEEMIEGESKDDCKIVVKISPTTPTRSAILEQLNDDDEWDEVSTAKSKSGKITFSIDATDEDDAWLDGDFTFRVTVKNLAPIRQLSLTNTRLLSPLLNQQTKILILVLAPEVRSRRASQPVIQN